MTIPVLIPWRSDGGHRQKIWDYLQSHYWAHLPQYRIVEGACGEGAFNRAQAVNDAASKAGDWTVAVIADADTWVPAHNLAAAVDKTVSTGKLTAAFDTVIELTEKCTDTILAEQPTYTLADLDVRNMRTVRLARSSMLTVTHDLWTRTGGMDEKFVEWGGEDEAFWFACKAIAREPNRVPGPAWHLYHTPASNRDTPQYQANLRRWQRYSRARNAQQLQHIRSQ
jgi:hypothetical protein